MIDNAFYERLWILKKVLIKSNKENMYQMVRKAARSKSEENGLPEWAENEIKFANFQEYDNINRTGYFLDINEQKKKADIQLYEALPDGRTIIEEIELSDKVNLKDLLKGFVYEYKIKISKSNISVKRRVFDKGLRVIPLPEGIR